MTPLSALAIAACATAQLQGERPTVAVGPYRIDGKEVMARIPSAEGPISDGGFGLIFQGDRYAVDAGGRIIRRFRARGGWSEVYSPLATPRAGMPSIWRIKAFLLPRVSIVDVAPDGVARIRGSQMESSEIAHVGDSLAKFAAIVEAVSGRRIVVTIDTEVDPDAFPTQATKGIEPLSNAELAEYLEPRFNGGQFDAEDRQYRGPYDSVFVIHAGLRSPSVPFRVNDTSVAPIAYYSQGPANGPDALAFALANAWIRQVDEAVSKAGSMLEPPTNHDVRLLPGERAQGFGPLLAFDARAMGALVSRLQPRLPVPTEAFLAQQVAADTAPRPWSEAAEDPLTKLPSLTLPRLATLLGAPELLFEGDGGGGWSAKGLPTSPRPSPAGPDHVFEPGKEALARFDVSDGRSILLVDATFAELFAAGIEADHRPMTVGWITVEGRRFLVLQADRLPQNVPEAAWIRLPGSTWTPGSQVGLPALRQSPDLLVPNGQTGASVATFGSFYVRDARDSERGDVLSIHSSNWIRAGGLHLAAANAQEVSIDVGTNPILSFFVKAERPDPMVLRLSPEGSPDVRLRLFGRLAAPSEVGDDPHRELAISGGPNWQPVVIDLKALGIQRLRAVCLESNEWLCRWPAHNLAAPSVLIDDVRLSATAPSDLTAFRERAAIVPDPKSESIESRIRFAAAANLAESPDNLTAVVELVKDPSDTVVLNAVRNLSRSRGPAVEAALVEALSSLNLEVVAAAAEGLAAQNSPDAWAALKRAVEIGPFDFTRVEAARRLGAQRDSRLTATFSRMLTAASWRGRAYAAQALGMTPGESAPLVLMAFLHEKDPGVRLAVVKAANVTLEEVCKRLLWSAVNDPIDEIRAWSCMRLIQSGKSTFVSEALKGVRDESIGMRTRLLSLLKNQPTETARPALRLAVTDAAPSVRAAALEAFAVLPGPVRQEEVENTLADRDPRVKRALADLRRAKGF